MIIHVTQEDIDKGKALDPFLCPVAKAIKRQIKGATNVSVGSFIFIIGKKRKFIFFKERFKYTLRTPKRAASFIVKFDSFPLEPNRDLLRPFSFELDLNAAL